jgi:hypothetical protein
MVRSYFLCYFRAKVHEKLGFLKRRNEKSFFHSGKAATAAIRSAA